MCLCSLNTTVVVTGELVRNPYLETIRIDICHRIELVTHKFHISIESEFALLRIAIHAMNGRQTRVRYVLMPVIMIFSVFAMACSSPPVSEFNATTDSGNAPLDVSFLLGELADADSYRWDFGDGSGSTDEEPTHTFEFAGEFIVTLSALRGDQIATSSVTVQVEPGVAGWVVVEGESSPVTSFETIDFSANAFDALGNPIEDVELRWSVDEAVGVIDATGRFTAGTQLGRFRDAVTVEFERLGVTVFASAGVEIVEGSLHAISFTPNEIDVQAGRSVSVDVQAVDEAGHVLEDALVLYTALRTGDEIDITGLFEPNPVVSEEEIDLIAIKVELDGNVIEANIPGHVRAGIVDQVHISSLPTTMEIGETFQLSAYGTDRFDNLVELDNLEWSVSDAAIGSITEDGLFTAGSTAGTHSEEGIHARAYLDGIESVALAPVTIVAGAVESIHIVPDADSVPINAGSPFVVLATDKYGNIIDIPEEEYVYEYSDAGRGNEVAVFIAGYEIGDFENAITVTLPAGVAGNETDLVVQSDITVRQRSSNIIAVEVVDQDGGGIFFFDLETAQIGAADLSFNNNGFVEMSPSWWPDGSRLVYVSDPTGELQVYTLDIDTREIVQLTDVAGGVSMPHISADGSSIVMVGLEDESWQLYTADIPEDVDINPITMGMATRVSVDDEAQHILPYWSPDRSKILSSLNTGSGLVRVVLIDPTLQQEPDVIGPFGSVGFGWTVDGSGIHIGLSSTDEALDLGTLELGKSTPEFIDSSLKFLIAAWAPDDSELVAIDSLLGAGWLIDSDGSGLRRVISAEQVPTRMSWRPREYGEPVAIPELEGEPTMLSAGDELRGPVGALDTSLDYGAVISTPLGDIEIELYDDDSPMTVENFINLARTGFYDGLEFYRVVTGFASQTGDKAGDGTGGPGYMFNDEFNRSYSHDQAGVLSMANAGSNTNGSQFFITHDAATWLDAYDENGLLKNCADNAVSCHSIFGRVTSGIDVVTGMDERDPETATEPGVIILGITITES